MDNLVIKYFISAARNLNFTKAAGECFITQTAMSMRMAKLEEEIGVKLFERTGRNIALTDAGQVFYEEAVKLDRAYDLAVSRAFNASLGYTSTLRIGFSHYLERNVLPQLLPRFQKLYPHVHIQVHQDKQWILREQLKHGHLDLIIDFPYDLVDLSNVCVRGLGKYPVVVAVSGSHVLAGNGTISAGQIQREVAYIVDSGEMPGIYNKMWDSWRQSGIEPRELRECNSLDSILLMVEAGCGIAILPSYIRRNVVGDIVFLELDFLTSSLIVALAYLENNNNPALPLFLQVFQKFKDEGGG